MTLNSDVQAFLADAGERLKKAHPEMEFCFLLIPFHRSQLTHLSTEDKKQMEKEMVHAASREGRKYLSV